MPMLAPILCTLLCGAAADDDAMATLQKGLEQVRRFHFEQAVPFLSDVLYPTPRVKGDAVKDARIGLAQAYFFTNQKPKAERELQRLVRAFPKAKLDANLYPPDFVAFFDSVRRATPAPRADVTPKVEFSATPLVPATEPASEEAASEPVVEATSMETRPMEIVLPTVKPWRWYYLTPLGIGQYLAGSPVRGTIFLLGQAGLLATNIATYVLFRQLTDANLTSDDPRRAQTLQIVMNTAFFGALAFLVAGLVDGAFFEP